jgi:hypothetical protein
MASDLPQRHPLLPQTLGQRDGFLVTPVLGKGAAGSEVPTDGGVPADALPPVALLMCKNVVPGNPLAANDIRVPKGSLGSRWLEAQAA